MCKTILRTIYTYKCWLFKEHIVVYTHIYTICFHKINEDDNKSNRHLIRLQYTINLKHTHSLYANKNAESVDLKYMHSIFI